jgi:hypothetical protein
MRASVEATGARLEHVYVAEVVDDLPVGVLVSRAGAQPVAPIDLVTAGRIRGLRRALANEYPSISSPRVRRVDGERALAYDVSYSLRGRTVFQRFVDVKRGTSSVLTAMFTAPTRRAFRRHLPEYEALLRRWRWAP